MKISLLMIQNLVTASRKAEDCAAYAGCEAEGISSMRKRELKISRSQEQKLRGTEDKRLRVRVPLSA